MFILQIKDIKDDTSHWPVRLKHLTSLKKEFAYKIKSIESLKKLKKPKNLGLLFKTPQTSENFVKYIIGISLLNTTTSVYVTDIKGKVYFFSSAGSLGATGSQKIKKPAIIIKLLRQIILKINFNPSSRVVLHLKNFTKFYVIKVLSLLKKYVLIELVKIYNNKPHNGCRPKKLIRKKRKRLFF